MTAGQVPSARRLEDALDAKREQERRRAVRGLLRSPLVTPTRPDDELLVLVRRHSTWLREWFWREAGWPLTVDAASARLVKLVADRTDPTRPAVDRSRPGTPFGRRRYVLLCLALAALERAEAQVTLGRLVDHVVALAADPQLQAAGVAFRFEGRDEKADLAAVARLLLGLGALSRVAGEEQAFVASTGDVLYDVDRRVLAQVLAVRRGPSLVGPPARESSREPDVATRLDQVLEEPRPDTEGQRNLQIRHALARRLLDDPVLYFDELRETELVYLRSQRGPLLRRLTEGSGLVAEVRAEGIALLDPTGEATDLGMPEEGTDGHVTLLLAEHLADAAHATGAGTTTAQLEAFVAAAAVEHRTHWRRDATVPGAERELTAQALHRLLALRLVRRDGDRVLAAPALARFAFGRPVVTGSATDGNGS